MFLHLSVSGSLTLGPGCVWLWDGGCASGLRVYTPWLNPLDTALWSYTPWTHPTTFTTTGLTHPYSQQTGSTHSTGILSCFKEFWCLLHVTFQIEVHSMDNQFHQWVPIQASRKWKTSWNAGDSQVRTTYSEVQKMKGSQEMNFHVVWS